MVNLILTITRRSPFFAIYVTIETFHSDASVQVYIQVIDRENDGRDLHRFRSVLENDNKRYGSEIGIA
jgi:hypothetical protein